MLGLIVEIFILTFMVLGGFAIIALFEYVHALDKVDQAKYKFQAGEITLEEAAEMSRMPVDEFTKRAKL